MYPKVYAGYPALTVVWQNSDGSSLSNNRLVSGSPMYILFTGVDNVTSISVELMVIGNKVKLSI